MPDENDLKKIHDKLDLILSAFPEREGKPDPLAHRTYHEKAIAKEEESDKLLRELKLTVAKGTLWAFIVFLGWAALEYIKQRILEGS